MTINPSFLGRGVFCICKDLEAGARPVFKVQKRGQIPGSLEGKEVREVRSKRVPDCLRL